jgi:hypothetical protein
MCYSQRCFIAVFLAGIGAVVAVPLTWAQTLDWEPKSLNFGAVLIGGETAYRTLTLINTDPSKTLTITGIEYTYNDRGAFGWKEPLPKEIPPDSSVGVELSFSPPDISFFSAELQIANNSANVPVLIYFFMGMGTYETTTTIPPTTTTTTTTTTVTTTTTTVPVPACGDPTGDGSITATDAFFTLTAAVGIRLCDLWVCDVNDDGKVAASDAQRILNVAVGIPVALLCPS